MSQFHDELTEKALERQELLRKIRDLKWELEDVEQTILVMAVNAHKTELLKVFWARVEVVVYLRDDTRQSEIDHLLGELAAYPEVSRVNYVSKRDALERAQRELPEFGQLFLESEVFVKC